MSRHLLLFTVSLALLYAGATALVRGGATLALRLGVSALVVGLTVVAAGTSMPELLVSAKAALAGQGDIALGNVVGSNIFNIAVILGLAAVVSPLKVQFQLIRLDTPVMILVTGVFWLMFRDHQIGRGEAAVLFVGLLAYSAGNLHLARRQATGTVVAEFSESLPPVRGHWAVDLAFIGGGLGLLILGSRVLVDSAVVLARGWGVREAVIGLTIVAAGTSMPELATTVVAARKKQSDIAVGNVVGSNIYNLLGIAGVSGLLTPLEGPGIRSFDLGVMMLLSVGLLPMLWSGLLVKRWEGAVLLGSYAGYLALQWPK